MSYLQGWGSATERLDAKCGRGWKSGAGGKCVRNKISKKKVALGAVALGGLAATGAAAVMMAKKRKKEKMGQAEDEVRTKEYKKREKAANELIDRELEAYVRAFDEGFGWSLTPTPVNTTLNKPWQLQNRRLQLKKPKKRRLP